MDKKLTAIISAVVALLIVVGVGLFIYFNNGEDDILDESSYSSVELSAENILFAQNSNKPNIELLLDEELFLEAFGSKAINFSFRKTDRIRIHFSDGRKFEVEPDDETVKIKKDKNVVSIKIYTDERDIFTTVNKLIKFDTACSVKIFFDEGAFELNGDQTKAVTFLLKSESKLVSDVEKVYMKVTYENYVLKFSMTDLAGNDMFFTASGNTDEKVVVFTDEDNKYSFNSRIVTTEFFKTAILNPSDSLDMKKDVFVYVPDGFFVSENGNRIQVLELKNTASNIKLAELEEEESEVDPNVQTTVLTTTDGVSVVPFFENDYPDTDGGILRNLIEFEVVIPTESVWNNCRFSGTVTTSSDVYSIDSDDISVLKSNTVDGYIAYVSLKNAYSCEMGGVEMGGILFKDSDIYDVELTVTDPESKAMTKIIAPIEN